LTEKEKKRNTFGSALLFTYNPKNTQTIPSNLSFFPNIENCQSESSEFHLPETPPHMKNPFRLLPGVLLGTKLPLDIPTLKFLEIEEAKPANIHVDVFGNRSQKPSLLLYVKDNYDHRLREQIAEKYVGKMCWLWPYNREILVESMGDSEFEFFTKKSPKKLSEKESENWRKRAESIENKWKDTKAVKCYCSNLISVRYAVRTRNNKKVWSYKLDYVPLSMIIPVPPKENEISYDNLSHQDDKKKGKCQNLNNGHNNNGQNNGQNHQVPEKVAKIENEQQNGHVLGHLSQQEKNSIKEVQIHKDTEIEQTENHKEPEKYILSQPQETENTKESQKRTEYKESNTKTHPTNDETHPTNDEKEPQNERNNFSRYVTWAVAGAALGVAFYFWWKRSQ